MKQEINIEQKLNDLNHDYQRMRKLANRRINKKVSKFNKDRAREEREIQRKLGGESWVHIENKWIEKVIWIAVGLLIGIWLH